MRVLTTLKTLTIVTALMSGTALAMAQNGPPTGGERPVAGGANGGGPTYGEVYGYGYEYQPQQDLYAYHTSRRYRHWHY